MVGLYEIYWKNARVRRKRKEKCDSRRTGKGK
jgi:hypothetical protein